MTIAVTSTLTGLTHFVGQTFRSIFSRPTGTLSGENPYERGPVDRDEIEALMGTATQYSGYKSKDLCASERHELDTMSIIRGALYAKS